MEDYSKKHDPNDNKSILSVQKSRGKPLPLPPHEECEYVKEDIADVYLNQHYTDFDASLNPQTSF